MFSPGLKAENLIDEIYEGVSGKTNPIEARREILKKAAREVSLKYIRQIIGNSKVTRYQSTIQAKILSQSDKYILLVKDRNLKREKEGFKMMVNMKLSAKNLRETLLAEGLLYKIDGPPKVIPMISFIDRVKGTQISWWGEIQGTNSHLYEYSAHLEREFKEQLLEKGFYVISPLKYRLQSSLPRALLSEYMKREDYRDMAVFLEGAVVIRGSVEIK